MTTMKDSHTPHPIQATHHSQHHPLPSTTPIKVQEPNPPFERRERPFSRKLLQILFYLHIFLITVLTIFLTLRGIIFDSDDHHFRPWRWYPPLLTATASAGIVGLTWQWITCCNPAKALRAAFWLGPLSTCAAGILFFGIGSAGSLATAALTLVFAIIQSLYACWANHRFDYAVRVLSVSVASPPAKTTRLAVQSILVGTLYSCVLVSGIGGATATGTTIDTILILVILLSLGWTMQVIKNTLQVTISHVKFMHFSGGADFDTSMAVRDTIKHSIGSVCIGSVLVPVLGVIRGSARAASLVSGDADEFMFSCTNCYSGVASRLITYGNRWGVVHVGVYSKGFVQASIDTWEMFRRAGLEPLIDSDLTSSFCFLCGVTGGAVCALVGGSWALVVYKEYATTVSIYAFLIGYFMCRVAMAWPQACVSAYYVAYSENPESLQFDSTIPVRLEQLQRSQV